MAEELAAEIRLALRDVIDPELGINVVDLGLIYEIKVKDGLALIEMTMTTVGCPAANYIRDAVQAAAAAVPGVAEAEVSVVWDPPWTPEQLSAAGRQYFGWEPEPQAPQKTEEA